MQKRYDRVFPKDVHRCYVEKTQFWSNGNAPSVRSFQGGEAVPYSELDCVALTEDLPEEGLLAGAEGTIVHVFNVPSPAYIVEFLDEEGFTIDCLTLKPEQVRLVWEYKVKEP